MGGAGAAVSSFQLLDAATSNAATIQLYFQRRGTFLLAFAVPLTPPDVFGGIPSASTVVAVKCGARRVITARAQEGAEALTVLVGLATEQIRFAHVLRVRARLAERLEVASIAPRRVATGGREQESKESEENGPHAPVVARFIGERA